MSDKKNRKRNFLNKSTVVGLNAMRWAMSSLPQWCVKGIIAVLTPFIYMFMGKHKVICRENFIKAYGDAIPESQFDHMIRTCIVNVSVVMTDLLYYTKRPHLLEQRAHIHNEERLKESLEEGKGVVCVSAHMGNFPLMFIMLIKQGYKVNVIIRPMRNKQLSAFMFGLCDEWGINMIETVPRRQFIKKTFKALKENELLFILLDEVVPDDVGVEVEFFGTKVQRAVGPLLYHQKFGSDILPMFVTKDEDGEFHIHVEEKMVVENTTDAANVSAITKIVERYVKRYPLQWGGWFNKRWTS